MLGWGWKVVWVSTLLACGCVLVFALGNPIARVIMAVTVLLLIAYRMIKFLWL